MIIFKIIEQNLLRLVESFELKIKQNEI